MSCTKELVFEVIQAEWIAPVRSIHKHNNDDAPATGSNVLHWTKTDNHAQTIMKAGDADALYTAEKNRLDALERQIQQVETDLAALRTREATLRNIIITSDTLISSLTLRKVNASKPLVVAYDSQIRVLQKQKMEASTELMSLTWKIQVKENELQALKMQRDEADKKTDRADAAQSASRDVADWSVYNQFADGSIIPGVFAGRFAAGDKILRLTFRTIRSHGCAATENCKVTGAIGALKLVQPSVAFNTAVGAKTVCDMQLEKKRAPAFARFATTAASWSLTLTGCKKARVSTNTSRHELFFTYDTFRECWQNLNAVRIEVLRLAWLAVGKKERAESKKKDFITKVTKYLFAEKGFTYDTTNGAPAYYRFGEFCPYAYCVSEKGNVVNCYDQAAGVACTGQAVGIPVVKTFVDHFGYIHRTKLVGNIDTNNPFSVGHGSSALVQYYTVLPAVATASICEVTKGSNATVVKQAGAYAQYIPDTAHCSNFGNHFGGFGNHEFAEYSENSKLRYFDACGGPVVDKTLDGYFSTVINYEVGKTVNVVWGGGYFTSSTGDSLLYKQAASLDCCGD